MQPAPRQPDSSDDPAGRFATTQWSLVLAAGERGNAESDRALERLCRAYWPPLYAYARRRVANVHEAQDLTQAFFERLLEKKYLAQVDARRGRFRAFLVAAFKHFLSNKWKKARAAKRGGGRPHFSLDFAAHELAYGALADTLTPERLFERRWAITLLHRVMRRLQREMERGGKGQQFQALKDLIAGTSQSSYLDAAARLEIGEPAARMAASRLRARYRALLREEIAQTVSSADDIDDEVRHLFQALAD